MPVKILGSNVSYEEAVRDQEYPTLSHRDRKLLDSLLDDSTLSVSILYHFVASILKSQVDLS